MTNPTVREMGINRRRQIMEVISREDGPHTLRGIANAIGLSIERTYDHVCRLRKEGYITEPKKWSHAAIYPKVKFGEGEIK